MDPHDMSLAEQDEWLKKQAAWTEDEEKSAMEKLDTGPPLLVIWWAGWLVRDLRLLELPGFRAS